MKELPSTTIPLRALPPVEHCYGPNLELLLEYIKGRFQFITPDISDVVVETIYRIIQMFVPLDDITGLALSETEKSLDPESKKDPLVCKLSRCFFDPEDKLMSRYIRDLGLILRAEETLLRFPVLGQNPSPRKNPLWNIHADLISYPAYSTFACDLQVGLVLAWKHYGWTEENIKNVSSLATSARRILPELTVDDLQTYIDKRDEIGAADLIHNVADNLTYLGHYEWLPMNTRELYFRNFCTVIDKEYWLKYPRRGKGGGHSGQRRRPTFYDIEDDLPEGGDAPDGFLSGEYEQFAHSLEEELAAEEDFLDGEEDLDESLPKGRFTYSEERAVMQEYLNPLAWNCTHPQELAWLVAQLLTRFKNNPVTVLILSVIFLGRSTSWLLRIAIEKNPDKEELLEMPTYYPKHDLVLYPPELAKYPDHPLKTEDLFIPISRNWAVPLPHILIPLWKNLVGNLKEGDLLFKGLTQSMVKEQLKTLTESFRVTYPSAPKFTEGRLRRAFIIMSTQTGLNEVYGGMISGQWRLPLRTPLHYTTLTFKQLADRFRPASHKIYGNLCELNPAVPEQKEIELVALPEKHQGSPYHPRPEVFIEIIDALIIYLKRCQPYPHNWQNARTLAVFIGMNLFCGLRFSELCESRVVQFDLHAIWKGHPLPWLQLPDAKGNRFTTASRLVPIPTPILSMVKIVLNPSSDRNTNAFWGWVEGNKQNIDRDILDQWREEAQIPLLRWHSSRQALNSSLFLCTTSMTTANIVLGHQAAGRELFNPYLPGDPTTHWQVYLDYCDRLAVEIGWKGVLDVIFENITGTD